MPLALRRRKLTLQFMIKLKSNPSIPAYSCVLKSCRKAIFDARPTAIATIGIRMQQQLSKTGINLDCLARSGCVVYGSARESYLQPLDRMQNAPLRVCLGAFGTSHVSSLHVEANEMPLALRRRKLTLQFMIKLKSNPSIPAYSCVLKSCRKAIFDARPTAIATTGIRMQQQLSKTGINLDCLARSGICAVSLWLLQSAKFIDSLHQLGSKSEIAPDLFRSKPSEMLEVFDDCERLYTDAPKTILLWQRRYCRDLGLE
jgi:hypothetical protein